MKKLLSDRYQVCIQKLIYLNLGFAFLRAGNIRWVEISGRWREMTSVSRAETIQRRKLEMREDTSVSSGGILASSNSFFSIIQMKWDLIFRVRILRQKMNEFLAVTWKSVNGQTTLDFPWMQNIKKGKRTFYTR